MSAGLRCAHTEHHPVGTSANLRGKLHPEVGQHGTLDGPLGEIDGQPHRSGKQLGCIWLVEDRLQAFESGKSGVLDAFSSRWGAP